MNAGNNSFSCLNFQFSSQFVHSSRIQIQMTHWCQRLQGSTRQIGKSITSWHKNGHTSMHSDHRWPSSRALLHPFWPTTIVCILVPSPDCHCGRLLLCFIKTADYDLSLPDPSCPTNVHSYAAAWWIACNWYSSLYCGHTESVMAIYSTVFETCFKAFSLGLKEASPIVKNHCHDRHNL